MYKYIDILITSTFFMSIYVLYGNYRATKRRKDITSMLIISLIIVNRFHSGGILNAANSNYICEIIIMLFIIQLNIRERDNNKIKLLITINYVVGFISLGLIYSNVNYIYINYLNTLMMMTTLYIFSKSIYTSKKKNKYYLIVLVYFTCISFSLIIDRNEVLTLLEAFLNITSSVYIFSKIFINSMAESYSQKKYISKKLSQSNIDIKIQNEKLIVNKKISKTIYESIEKKNKILDLILDQSNRCVLLIDDEGYILNEDNSFSKMWKEYEKYKFNINVKIFLNQSIKNKDDFIDNMRLCSNNREEINIELEGCDGRFFSCTLAPLIIQNQTMGIICSISDITYKKKSEIKIRENDVKYKKIVDNIPYSILLTNDDNILYNNEKNEDVDFYKEDLKNIILQPSTSGELHYFNDNTEICLNIDRVNFAEGEENRNLIVIRDITEYKKLLRDVEYNKKKYEALVNIIPEGIYISDYENKNITYSNSKFLEMLGSDNIHEADIDRLHESMVITSGASNDMVTFNRNTAKNIYGESVHIESGAMLIDVNHRLKLIGIVRDITDQVKTEIMEREIEERKRANKIKDEFFINMSHELKTPLNLIHSSNQLIEALYREDIAKNSIDELSNATGVVKKHIYMLMALINNIMDLAKLESDFHYVNKDNYNIIDIIEDVVCEFNRYININNIDILFDTDEEERIANVDPHDIEKIVLTLLSLVIRYSKNNSTINVDLTSKRDKTIINIKNSGGYDYSRYINDQAKRNLDIGVTVAELIISLYNGSIEITNHSEHEVNIYIEIATDESVSDCKTRTKDLGSDTIYEEYVRMCNF